MNPLLDSLRETFSNGEALSGLPAQIAASRQTALDAALRGGLPGPRSEAWKYTSLRALERRRFSAAPRTPADIDTALLADLPAPRLVFVNGRHAGALSDLSELPPGVRLQPLSAALASGEEAAHFLGRRFEHSDEIFARLNTALADEGVVLRVDADTTVALPIHLVFIAAAAETDHTWHHRHLIELRQGARLQLVEHQRHQGQTPHLANTLMHVHLAAGAKLAHARIQSDASAMTALLRTDAVLARDALYRRVDLELGGALSRHELNVRLEGNHAQLSANGVLLGHGRRHLDTRLNIEHIARDTACELLWRGVGGGRSRLVFHGGIHIRTGADGSNAQLSNKNLLLSVDAEIDTQPVLVIDADEVQASHGATVGQLDDNALFYLRSRGVPKVRAQQLLSSAFCRAPLGGLDSTLLEILETQLDHALNAAGVA